jgi:regulation of enolase protein 1 (concanavalin A-like superfamily)
MRRIPHLPIVAVLIVTSFVLSGCAPTAQRQPIQPVATRVTPGLIKFESATNPNQLDPRFVWDQGGIAQNDYALGSSPDSLTMIAGPDSDYCCDIRYTAPTMAFPIEGDFTGQVKVIFRPVTNYQRAGLGIRLPGNPASNLIVHRNEINQIEFGPSARGTARAIPYNGTTYHLRIKRRGPLLSYYFSSNGTTWNVIQEDWTYSSEPRLEIFMYVLSARNNVSISAQFSDFAVTP